MLEYEFSSHAFHRQASISIDELGLLACMGRSFILKMVHIRCKLMHLHACLQNDVA